MTEDEMAGWRHRLNAHECEQTQGDSEGQGSLPCCSPWGCKELNMVEHARAHAHTHTCTYLYKQTVLFLPLCIQARRESKSFFFPLAVLGLRC